MIVETWLGVLRHFGAGLGAKILNDDFLQMSISLGQSPQFEQSSKAFVSRFADPDKDPGCEWNRRFPGGANDVETHRGMLIRRAEMRTAACAKPLRRTFQHQTLRHGNAPQRREFAGGHDPRIKVRKEAGFLQYQRRHRAEVRKSRVVPEFGQFSTSRAVA